MGFNVFLFVIVQLGLEPWRRRRLVGGFEEKVREVIQEETLRSVLLKLQHPPPAVEPTLKTEGTVEGAELAMAAKAGEEQDEIDSVDASMISQVVEDASISEPEAQTVEEVLNVQKPSIETSFSGAVKRKAVVIKEKVNQLFSEQVISLRQRDLTTVVVESATAGAFVTGVVAFLWNR